jgi:hypothetical protein
VSQGHFAGRGNKKRAGDEKEREIAQTKEGNISRKMERKPLHRSHGQKKNILP